MDTFGDRLKEERERVGLTQVALADLAGVSKSAQVGWESGRSVPNAAYLVVAMAQGIDVTYVLTGVRLDERRRHMFKTAAHATLTANMTPEARAESAGLLAIAMQESAMEQQQSDLISAWERCSDEDRQTALRVVRALAADRAAEGGSAPGNNR